MPLLVRASRIHPAAEHAHCPEARDAVQRSHAAPNLLVLSVGDVHCDPQQRSGYKMPMDEQIPPAVLRLFWLVEPFQLHGHHGCEFLLCRRPNLHPAGDDQHQSSEQDQPADQT
jgi:hypothetical protein